MKFTIEVEDFWLGNSELEPALKEYITKRVVKQIFDKIEKKVDDAVTREAKNRVEQQTLRKINVLIDKFIETGRIPSSNYSDAKQLSVEEYINERFTKNSGWSSPLDQIDRLAKKFGDEMKKRYDLVFATHVVKKLDTEGLLKENVAKLVLEEHNKS